MAYVGPYTLIIPEGVLKNASDVFTILDPDSGGADTFSVPLSADGQQPATHFAARTMLLEQTHKALTTMTTTQFKKYVEDVAAGYKPPRSAPASVVAFKNAVLIDGGNPWTFIAAQGLRRVSTDAPM